MSEFEKEISAKTNERGQVDLNDLGKAIDKAEERANQRILDHNEKIRAREEAKLKAEQEEINKLMSGLSEQVEAEDKEKAEAELRKAEAKQKEELQKEIYSKHNVKTDKEIERDEAYKEMLKGLKL